MLLLKIEDPAGVVHYIQVQPTNPIDFFQIDVNYDIMAQTAILFRRHAQQSIYADIASELRWAAYRIDRLLDIFDWSSHISFVMSYEGASVRSKYINTLFNVLALLKDQLSGKGVKYIVNNAALVTFDYDSMRTMLLPYFTNALMLESTAQKSCAGISVVNLQQWDLIHLDMTAKFLQKMAQVSLDDSAQSVFSALAEELDYIIDIAGKIDPKNKLPPFIVQPLHVIYKN